MAAYELTIKAASLTDLDTAVAEIAERFSEGGFPASQAGVAPRPRRRSAKPDVAAAAPAPDAEAVSPAAEAPVEADAGGDRPADAGGPAAVEPEQAAAAEGDGAEAEAAASERSVRSQEEEGAEAAAQAAARAQAEQAAAADAAPAPPAEDVKAAVQRLMDAKGLDAATGLFKTLGIGKPGQTPPERVVEVLAAINAAVSA